MKARVKATGKIVEVECVGISNNLHYEVYKVEDLDFDNFDTPDYWTRLEHQYAGMAMQGFLASGLENTYEKIAEYSIEQAHALVEKLKEKEERK